MILNLARNSKNHLWVVVFVISGYCLTAGRMLNAGPTPIHELFEIRMMRDRFFEKSGRFEAAFNFGLLANDAFLNAVSFDGFFTFHLSEFLGIGLVGEFNLPFFSSEHKQLEDEWAVFPLTSQTELVVGLDVCLTPVYGKASSRAGVLYFDTFVRIGGGMTFFKTFQRSPDATKISNPSSHLSALITVGQHFYTNDFWGMNLAIKDVIVFYKPSDLDHASVKAVPGYVPNEAMSFKHVLHAYLGFSYFL